MQLLLLLSVSRIYLFITCTYQILFYVRYSSLGTFARHLPGDKLKLPSESYPWWRGLGGFPRLSPLLLPGCWEEALPLRPV